MAVLHVLGILLKILGFTVLGILGLVLLALIILLIIPVGADIEYIGGRFKLSAKVCGILIQLLPKRKKDESKPPKEKKEKKKKEKKSKKEKPEGEEKKKKKKLELTKEEIFEIIQKVLKSLGKFGKLTVDRFLLHYTAGGQDPYKVATTLAYVNASLCALEPICSRQFNVKEYDIWTDSDFVSGRMKLDAALCITLRLWQFVHVGICAAFAVLGVILRSKRRAKKEKRLAAKNGGDGIISEEKNENIQGTEERNDENG